MNAFAALAVAISVAAMLLAAAMACCATIKHDRVGKIAQIEFVLLLLGGIFSVTLGSLLMALRPTSTTCIISMWAIVIGYALQLFPLAVKAYAIAWIVRRSKKMKRADVDKKRLLNGSVALTAIAACYCGIWTIIDPPGVRRDEDMYYYCESDSHAWIMVFFACKGLGNAGLLYLAIKMRDAPKKVSESDEIQAMIYVSSIFLIFRVIIHVIAIITSAGSLAKYTLPSVFYAMEMICNIFIYFPQFFGEAYYGHVRDSLVRTFSESNGRRSSLFWSWRDSQPSLNRPPTDTTDRSSTCTLENNPQANIRQCCIEEKVDGSSPHPSAHKRVRFFGVGEEEKLECNSQSSKTPQKQQCMLPVARQTQNGNRDFGANDEDGHALQRGMESDSGGVASEHISKYDLCNDFENMPRLQTTSDDENNESRNCSSGEDNSNEC